MNLQLRSACIAVTGLISMLVGPVYARPVIVENAARIALPDSSQYFGQRLALDGNHLLAVVNGGNEAEFFGLVHFERQPDGKWIDRGRIASAAFDVSGSPDVAMDGTLAAFVGTTNTIQVLQRSANEWTSTPLSLPAEYVSQVAVVDGTIAVAGRSGSDSVVFLIREDASGMWNIVEVLHGAPAYDGYQDIRLSFTGAQTAFTNGLPSYATGLETHVFDLINGAWRRTAALPGDYDPISMQAEVALRNASDRTQGHVLYLDRRNSSGAWVIHEPLVTEEMYSKVRPQDVVVEGERAYAAAPQNDLRIGTHSSSQAGSVNVFDRNSAGRFIHVATLLASDGGFTSRHLGGALAADGNRVVAKATAANDPLASTLYVFDLPNPLPAPTRVQDTFEDTNAAGWTPWGSAQWSVVQSLGSYVYRQANMSGDARAILDSPIARNQSVEADVRVNVAGSTSWVGLMVRYVDSANFYYLTFKANNVLEIRKSLNGTFGPLRSATVDFLPGRVYRLRLEAVGSVLRAFVDGQLVAQVRDGSIPRGQAGLTMWKTSADFDNVIVTTSPRTTLWEDNFNTSQTGSEREWVVSPAGNWSTASSAGGTVFLQSSTSGDARAVNGAPAADQIVTAQIRPTGFNASGTGWVGLMARYQDDRNYYYVLLKQSGSAALRKIVNGQTTLFEEVPFSVAPGATYNARLEAVGNTLRLYVNGRLLAEGQDTTFTTGRYGLVTYRAAAEFDNFNAARP
jgi:hypothetical protein